ncbi:MAG TPA: hypothetical protein VFO82_16485 [Steroidobacteraceae bacterium]|nr:hypothetical protein [Steroidobacteraceae bacterium]
MNGAARLVVMLAVSSILGACISPYAPYAPYSRELGVNAVGYTETEVQPGVFLVQFIGNEHTPADRPADYALLRAADLCLQRGRNYMFVGNPAMHYMPTGSISETTVVPASETSQVVTMSSTLPLSPIGGVMVQCAETQANGAWDAQFLARAIRAKYSIS